MKISFTTHCPIRLLDFILRETVGTRKNASSVLAFTDFRKTFDLSDHITVIVKAINIGLAGRFPKPAAPGSAYQGATSNFQPLTAGMQQGTRMGPLCFFTLINDALMDAPHN